jgi:prepilin-type N-terminal cleavage/methylation domain-containing protein
MLQQLKNRKQDSGFTIIEVLIVLAIAGLILLIVFLAVPALQRSARNTQRKDDVGRITGSISDFISNNSGALPQSATDCTTLANDAGTLNQYTFGLTGSPAACPGTDVITTATCALTNANITISTGSITCTAPTETATVATAEIIEGDTCLGSVATTAGATNRNTAVIYSTEAGGGNFNVSCVTGS